MNDMMERMSKRLVEKLNEALDVPRSTAQDLMDCYLSGQISEEQWQGHLRENDGLVQLYSEYDLGKRRKRVDNAVVLYQSGQIPEDEWERLQKNDSDLRSVIKDMELKGGVTSPRGENAMNTTFEEIIEVVLAHEGGFVDDPDDRGGATNWGVTQAVWEDFLEDEFTSDDVREFTREQAIELYREEFWKPSQAEKLPEEIREVYFDMCVNHGQRNAVKILQTAANAKGGSLVVDGGIGPNTINASSNLSLSDVQIERSGFYWNLVFIGSFYGKRNRQEKFIRGWIRRCFNLK
tara:strand:- start:3946 stop:4821 length:876 start_codon:yes stop_codon:yes gene_type:complete